MAEIEVIEGDITHLDVGSGLERVVFVVRGDQAASAFRTALEPG